MGREVDRVHPKYFVDALTLLNTPQQGWQIIAKAFHAQVKASP